MKTKKPHKDFPLFLHRTGQWAKKVRGKMIYFGKDADAALEKWLDEKDALLAGRTPRLHPDGLTVRQLCNKFLEAKKARADAGDLSRRTWWTTTRRARNWSNGSRTAQWPGSPATTSRNSCASYADRFGPVALGIAIQRARTVFKYALDAELVKEPVRFGVAFKKPSRKMMRKAKNEKGEKLIEAADLRTLIDAAGVPMRAMILLGINCAYGQSDISALPLSAVDLAGAWINFPRVKTEIPRRCPLWPETVAALREAIESRPDPKRVDFAEHVFLTRFGVPWVRMKEHKDEDGIDKAGVVSDAVRLEFGKLLAALKMKRRGLGFYALRHTFRTVADRSKDQPGVDHLMGHIDGSMAANYRQRIDDDRLEAVTKVVRNWLWPVN